VVQAGLFEPLHRGRFTLDTLLGWVAATRRVRGSIALFEQLEVRRAQLRRESSWHVVITGKEHLILPNQFLQKCIDQVVRKTPE